MRNKLWVLVTVLALMVGTAAAQDARTLLQAASKAMGASDLKSIEYSGTGWMTTVGQSFGSDDDWPRADLKSYTRVIDYGAMSSQEGLVRVQGSNPPRGGGGQPIQGEQRQANFVSNRYAWNLNQQNMPNPQPAAAEDRQLEIWLTPHGFVKAAMAPGAAPTLIERFLALEGRNVRIVGFTAMGKYRVIGEFNHQNLLERVLTWIPNPVMGDMQVEVRYTEWKDFGTVKFPTHIHAHQGDDPLLPISDGRNWMDLRVTDVKANVASAALSVPDNVRSAAVPPVRVESQRLGDGVWLLAGGSHNSLAMEFREFIVVVEGPLNGERSSAVIAELKELIPNKPIRYLVNTHHHFDHLGGVRSYVAEGATVVTHHRNLEFYKRVIFTPQLRTLAPDSLSLFPFARTGPVPFMLETMTDQYSISDGERAMLIYHVEGLNHSDDMLIVYLPKEKILVNADLYSPPAQGSAPPANISQSAVSLFNNIRRLKLDVAQHVPIHGVPGSNADFERIVGPTAAVSTNNLPGLN